MGQIKLFVASGNFTNEYTEYLTVEKNKLCIMYVLYVEMKSLITYSESLQRLFLLWRLDFMGKKTNGYLWAESRKLRFKVTLKCQSRPWAKNMLCQHLKEYYSHNFHTVPCLSKANRNGWKPKKTCTFLSVLPLNVHSITFRHYKTLI